MPAESSETPIPTEELAAPARRALAGAGYTTLEQLAERSEAELAELHGMGPKGLRVLQAALDERDLAFSEEREDRS